MPACGISNNEGQGSGVPGTGVNCEKYFKNVGGREVPGRRYKIAALERLRLDDCDNLVRARIDDHDLLTDQNVVIATPFRIDDDDLLR